MIPNKFLCYLTEEAFNEELGQGIISDKSIVLVLDKGFIYSHGTYFYCNFSPEVEKVISTSITKLDQALQESNKVIAQALCQIKSNMLEKKDFNLEEINTDLENKRQEIVEEVTELSKNISNDLVEFKESTITEVSKMTDQLGESERISAHSLSDLDKRLSETNITLGHVINELKSQISDLKNKINTE